MKNAIPLVLPVIRAYGFALILCHGSIVYLFDNGNQILLDMRQICGKIGDINTRKLKQWIIGGSIHVGVDFTNHSREAAGSVCLRRCLEQLDALSELFNRRPNQGK